MPEAVMIYVPNSTSLVETAGRIQELRKRMEHMDSAILDGYSESDSSSDDSDTNPSVVQSTRNLSAKTHHNNSKTFKNGLKSRTGTSSRLLKHRTVSVEEKKKVPEKEHKKYSDIESADQSSKTACEDNVSYTYRELEPIIVGQSKEDLQVPIMTPPPILEPPPKFMFKMPVSAFYIRPFSLSFLHAGDKHVCGFNDELIGAAKETLDSTFDNHRYKDCFCSSRCAADDFLTGWDRADKGGKIKYNRKRKSKNVTSDTSTFLRLTGALTSDRDDPVAFQYYEDTKKYIERYRFFHAVGNICRPRSEGVKDVVPVKKDIDNEPYFKNLKSSCAMATECDIYSLISTAKAKKVKQEVKRPASEPLNNCRRNKSLEDFKLKLRVLAWYLTKNSRSSEENEKSKSEDEDSNEEGQVDVKPVSMRDRGKTLNLAPVRECMVPELIQTDKLDQYQQNYIELNQYLNLMTPPSPGKNLQIQIDELKERRFGTRIINTGENNLFPACTPRRGARPLRLGSAEFVKPGSGETEPKWANEVKPQQTQNIQRASTFHSSTVPGNLIVGSTVTQSNHSAKTRTKHGGKSSPYVMFCKEHAASLFSQKPQTPPHHIYGKKFKPCERVNDLSTSKERIGRFPLSHSNNGSSNDKTISKCHTVMAVDLKDATSFKREKLRHITLDVNHLGIRGKTFQQDGQINVLYKDRRTATVKS